ncbi:MAG: hypothetical protein WD097_10055 [Balneolales bacterium]
MLRKTYAILLTSFLALVIWNCSDSPAGPDLSNAPDAPTIENVEMDFSVFEQAENYESSQMKSLSEFSSKWQHRLESTDSSAYEQAALFAFYADFWFQQMGHLPATFFNENNWGDPDLEGDTWIWEWHFAAQGESITMTVTAETVDNERHWELRYSTEGTESDLDNALLIASRIRLDGTGGNWELYDFHVEDPVFVVEYEFDGNITTRVDMRFDDEEEGRFLYQRDDSISTLQMWDVFSTGLMTIEWNNDNGTGSVQSPDYRDGEKVCWNEDFQDTEC